MKFIDLSAQYEQQKYEIDKRIKNVLEHGQYILGPEVQELEFELENFVGIKNVITCANGTDALTLALKVLNIGTGDVVFCPTFTFFATAEVIANERAVPVFVDSDRNTYNICPKNLEQQIECVLSEGKLIPRAIICVDLFGLPADYFSLRHIADKYGLILIEDAAQGLGGSIDGKRSGSFGDIATTSFFPAKPLGCYGDGGAVFTNNDDYANLIKSYRVHGQGKDKYDNVRVGMNSRLDTIQAAVLLEKLSVFNEELASRNAIADKYSESLSEKFITPFVPSNYYSSWAQYTLRANSKEHRDLVMSRLKEQNIPSFIYYRTCMHQQSVFKDAIKKYELFPVAEELAETVFSLPMHPYMSNSDLNSVLSVLEDC